METFILIISILVVHTLTIVSSSNLNDSEIYAFDLPVEMKEQFPYYLSGYDEEGAPIWIMEAGNWDVRKYVEQGGKHYDAIHIYVDRMYLMFRDSGLNSTAKQFIVICDVDGFSISQAGHGKTNALFQGIWQIGSRFLGQLANSVEVFGTNPETWKPKLLKQLPRDQIPEWYGGLPNHKPIKVLGNSVQKRNFFNTQFNK